jgi:hypothetical protein
MFNTFIASHLNDVKKLARKSRHIVQYDNIPIYEYILTYCKQKKLIVSNPYNMVISLTNKSTNIDTSRPGVDLTSDESSKAYSSQIMKEYKMNTNPFTEFVIYGTFVFRHANTMANEIAQTHTPFVELYTTLKNQMFSLKVNGGDMITFVDIRSNILKSIKPTDGKWLPPEIELLGIYHKLYSPQHYSDSDDLLKLEPICWKAILPPKTNKEHSGKSYPYNSILLSWLKNRTDCVLIGPTATTHPTRNNYRTQIITTLPLSDIVDDIKRVMKRLTNQSVTARIQLVDNIPGEYRLKKAVIMTKSGYIAEVYNSASYELVPYIIVGDIYVATRYVLLRFLMIDIWSVRILGTTGKISNDVAANIISRYFDIMNHVRDKKYKISMPQVLGVYIDDFYAKKRLALANNFWPYRPVEYNSINNKYREI